MNFKEFLHAMDKIATKPEFRAVDLTDEGTLVIKRHRDLVPPCFLTSGPRGVFAGINGSLWTPAGQEYELPCSLGFLTKKRFLVRGSGDKESDSFGFQWKYGTVPEGDSHFLLFIAFPRFAELFLITPSFTSPFHLTLPHTEEVPLLGLSIDLLAAYRPEEANELKEYLKSQRWEASHG